MIIYKRVKWSAAEAETEASIALRGSENYDIPKHLYTKDGRFEDIIAACELDRVRHACRWTEKRIQ